jgi:hypothetical protein
MRIVLSPYHFKQLCRICSDVQALQYLRVSDRVTLLKICRTIIETTESNAKPHGLLESVVEGMLECADINFALKKMNKYLGGQPWLSTNPKTQQGQTSCN